MKELVFLQAVPYDRYFQWQIEVQITHFRKWNISNQMQICVWYPKNGDLSAWYKLVKKYPEANFFFYEDDGVDLKLYIPLLRPFCFKKHFAKYPELSKKVIFYHDSDIIFSRKPEFSHLIEGDINWQSDTTGYLGYKYLYFKQKQGKIPNREAICTFAEIAGISPLVIASYRNKTGGAQYFLKGVDASFWEDVERMCSQIRKKFAFPQKDSINARYFTSENEGYQSWCADMWAVNFSLWKRGKVTNITKDLDFSWATDSYETYLEKPIYHNAGATRVTPNIFNKGLWIEKTPLGIPHPINEKSATKAYVQAISEVNV